MAEISTTSETNLSVISTSIYVSPCMNCFHFKTKIVHEGNITEEIFLYNLPLQKELFYNGQARIWFCVKSLLPRRFYMDEQKAMSVKNLRCSERKE